MNPAPPPVPGNPGDESPAQAPVDPARAKKRRKLRRRAAGVALMLSALTGTGLAAAALTPTPQVAQADEADQATLIREGKRLYEESCITCHGANLQGIPERGPSLIGVGETSVYFQVKTGRMPAVRQEAQMPQKTPRMDLRQIDAIGAYVQQHGGGPSLPQPTAEDRERFNAQELVQGQYLVGSGRGGDGDGFAAADAAVGGDLFRQNCASCHNFTGKGGTLSSGKYAPNLDDVDPKLIWSAMVVGPENMPKFSDRQLTPDEKKDVIAYVRYGAEASNPGGMGLGGWGPAAEAGFIWAVGIVAVVGATLWIGARS